MANKPEKTSTEPKQNATKLDWKYYLDKGDWTTYLAYQLKNNSTNPVDTLLKYEALLTQCSYLSRMAYCPADIFCRMTQHLDVTPNAFNNYIRAIEKIYDRLFNYKCSFDSKYIQEHPEFSKYFNPSGDIPASQTNAGKVENAAPKTNAKQVGIEVLQNNSLKLNAEKPPLDGGGEFNNTKIKEGNKPIGFFVQNSEHMNVYLYVHHNPESEFNTKKTLFIAFKGSSSINDFIHDLKSAAKEDLFLSELNEAPNKSGEFKMMEMSGGLQNNTQSQKPNPNLQNSTTQSQNNKKTITPGKAGWGFVHVLKPSIQDIYNKIEELKSNEFERIIITGHSLGGALASLFGYYLKQYKSQSIKVPIHVITFGACCVFDAPGRNEFNSFLNISSSEKSNIFTLDRVTSNFDPVIVLPPDLDHPGYTLLRTEFKAFTKTGRTNEIGEIRKMLGLERGYDGNDLLLSERFVNLFKNSKDFKGTGKFDTDLYRGKFRIKFGSNAKEQQLILENAMPDAIPGKIRELFNTIESDAGNKRYNNQKGGIHNPLSNKKRIPQKLATEKYKKNTETMMPNQIQYSCYKTMTMGFCHASYMGVSYIMVLRLPNIKGGYKAKKEPTKNYTLYQIEKDGKKIVYSLSPNGKYSNNKDCSYESKPNNSTRKNNEQTKLNNSNRINIGQTKPKKSLMNRFFGKKNTQTTRSNNTGSNNTVNLINEKTPLIERKKTAPEDGNTEEENQGVFSKCSIL